jgi:hypothetical protein
MRGNVKSRRGIEGLGLSFLDCICCGFGAIILLLVLSRVAEPMVLEKTHEELEGRIARLQEELYELRGETETLNRTLVARQTQLSEARAELARLQGDLSELEGEFAASTDRAAVTNIIEGRLASARQRLTAEMQRLLGAGYRRKASDTTIGGIPVDSEYIIFVIDTSGSMFKYSWNLMLRKLSETLDIYPQVKGIQVLNDMGEYMYSSYAGKWIPDTPARRRAIIQRLRTWTPFSNSSPVEGITTAIRSYYAPDRKISIYVFGDEFTGTSIESVVETVARINRADARGGRRVRIHAVGFPLPFGSPGDMSDTGTRFATLMRILCRENGGTFVGLTR